MDGDRGCAEPDRAPWHVPDRAVTEDTERLGQYLAHTIGGFTQPVTLVFDQLETVSSRKGRNLVAALAMALPAGSQLAWASREQVPFSLARMRVQSRVLEVGAADLAMSQREASLLLRAAGVELTDEATGRLVRQTRAGPQPSHWQRWGSERVMCQRTKGSPVRIG